MHHPIPILGALLLLALGQAATANFRFTREGYVSDRSTIPTSYVLAADPYAEPEISFTDPDGLLDLSLPGPYRLHLEVADVIDSGELTPCVLLGVDPLSSLLPPSGAGSDPIFSAGRDNGLYPSVEEPLPRAISGDPGPLSDRDGDGVPDDDDAFPDDPDETDDHDGDGIGDHADPDDDNDGITDTYELANGLQPFVDDAAGDKDGDRRNNLDEFVAGTAANDPASFFRVRASSAPGTGNPVRLQLEVRSDRVYQLYGTGDPAQPFLPLGSPIMPLATGPVTLTPVPPSLPYFYQIEVNLPEP